MSFSVFSCFVKLTQLVINKKIILIMALLITAAMLQSHMPKHDDDKPVNLKILPKDISEHDLHEVMREYSRALGVRCGYCHYSEKVEGQEKPKWNMASDAKKEKATAREMMLMTMAINSKHLANIKDGDRPLEQITCVTCHMGRTTPIVSVDSLPKPAQPAPPAVKEKKD